MLVTNKIKFFFLSGFLLFIGSCSQALSQETSELPSADGQPETHANAGHNTKAKFDKKLQFIVKNEPKIRQSCEQKKEVIKINDVSIFCFSGLIEKTDAELAIDEKETFSIAYVNSRGGDVVAAMKLGRKIHNNDAYLIVDGRCDSSCSNYLVPAAKEVYITDNTVITMHGHPPRHKWEFAASVLKAKGISKEDVLKDPSIFFDQINKREDYEKYKDEIIMAEVKYFLYIGVNEAYVTRFHEVIRTLKFRKNYLCNPPKGLYLIIGPEYLDEFYVSVIRPWFPSDKSEYLEFLSYGLDDYSLLFDFEEDPFWLSGRGLVSKQDCYTDIQEQEADIDN